MSRRADRAAEAAQTHAAPARTRGSLSRSQQRQAARSMMAGQLLATLAVIGLLWVMAGTVTALQVMVLMLIPIGFSNISVLPERRYFGFQRLNLLVICGLGAYLVLQGRVELPEFLLIGVCVLLNEVRARTSLERLGNWVSGVWIATFVMSPMVYLGYRMPSAGFSAFSSADFLPCLVVAMAMPFQAFASYVNELPRAQHLILAFTLVEIMLAVRQGFAQQHTGMLLFLMVLMLVALLFCQVSTALRAVLQGRRAVTERVLKSCLRPATGLLTLPVLISVLLLAFVLFLALAPLTQKQLAVIADTGDLPFASTDPRTGGDRSRSGRDISGLEGDGSQISLSELGSLVRDTSIIGRVDVQVYSQMHLRQAMEFLQNIRLRAASLTHFDGREWRVEPDEEPSLLAGYDVDVRDQQPYVARFSDATVLSTFNLVTPDIDPVLPLLVPGVMEALRDVVSVDESLDSASLRFFSDSQRAHVMNPEQAPITSYSVESRLALPGIARPGRRTQDLATLSRYTRLPRRIVDALQQEFKESEQFRSLPGRRGVTTAPEQWLTLAGELQQWFTQEGGYTYSLDERPQGERAIVDFIVDPMQRIGHCEYYASAMTVLLRMWGVPARVVVGYAPSLPPDELQRLPEIRDALSALKNYGTVTDLRKALSPEAFAALSLATVVRKSDAHAWVEVFDPAMEQWVFYDPTPAESRAREMQNLLDNPMPPEAMRATQLPPAAESSPEREEFSPLAFLTSYDGSQAKQAVDQVKLYLPDLALWGGILVGGGVVIVMNVVLVRYLRRRERRRGARSRRSGGLAASASAPTHFQALRDVLAPLGVARSPSATVWEFVQEIPPERAVALQGLDDVIRCYDRLRYCRLSDQAQGELIARYQQGLLNLRAQVAALVTAQEQA